MRKSRRIIIKKSHKRRYKTKCKRNTRRCARRKTRKQYGASGRRPMNDVLDEIKERLQRNDADWYNRNIVQAEERRAQRAADIEAQDRPEAFRAPSLADMNDSDIMRKHLETLDRAEEHDNQLLRRDLERSIARADAEEARENENEDRLIYNTENSLKYLYPITRSQPDLHPLLHYPGGFIRTAEKLPNGSKFRNIFKDINEPPKKRRRR